LMLSNPPWGISWAPWELSIGKTELTRWLPTHEVFVRESSGCRKWEILSRDGSCRLPWNCVTCFNRDKRFT
jgi:hypothetical protein